MRVVLGVTDLGSSHKTTPKKLRECVFVLNTQCSTRVTGAPVRPKAVSLGWGVRPHLPGWILSHPVHLLAKLQGPLTSSWFPSGSGDPCSALEATCYDKLVEKPCLRRVYLWLGALCLPSSCSASPTPGLGDYLRDRGHAAPSALS